MKIKFNGVHDLSTGWQLEKVDKYINAYTEPDDLEGILELYNVVRLLDSGVTLKSWSESHKKKLEKFAKDAKSAIHVFMKSVSCKDLIEQAKACSGEYDEDLLVQFKYFKLNERISDEDFEKIAGSMSIFDLLRSKFISRNYPEVIKKLLLSSENATEIILGTISQHTNSEHKIFLPSNLTKDEINEVFSAYVDSESPHPGYLRLISIAKKTDFIDVPDRLKFKAGAQADHYTEKMLEENSHVYEQAVVIHDDTEDTARYEMDGLSISLHLDGAWIRDNSDKATLLNNFIYLFNFADPQMNIELVAKESQLGIFERFMGVQATSEYTKGSYFQSMAALSEVGMLAYQDFLITETGTSIEQLIEWFFNTYINQEFGVEGFKISIPSEGTNYYEKCKLLLPELDAVIKQFKLYCEEGTIDHRFLESFSRMPNLEDVPSLVADKYVYLAENQRDLEGAMGLMFNDQSGLVYFEDINESYASFVEVISSEKIAVDNLPEYQIQRLQFLVDMGFIKELTHGSAIEIKDLHKTIVMKKLYRDQVISRRHTGHDTNKVIDEMLSKGQLVSGSSLFNREEVDYFSYHFDAKRFVDTLDLRNKYIHGSMTRTDELVHKRHYTVILKLFICAIIKINDDFCLKFLKEN